MQAGPEWISWIQENLILGVEETRIAETMRERGFDNPVITDAIQHAKATQFLGGDEQVNPFQVRSHIDLSPAERVNTDKAEIYVHKNFLTKDECAKIIEAMRPHLRPSTVVRQDEVGTSYRTSKSCDLGNLHDLFLRKIDLRIAKALGLSARLAEATQAQYYDVGEYYKQHHDYFVGDDLTNYDGPKRGQRTYTFMIYLNTTKAGGGTRFVHLHRDFQPKAGTAIIWNNLYNNGEVNPNTEHEALPVQKGFKAIITKWFRSKIAA